MFLLFFYVLGEVSAPFSTMLWSCHSIWSGF